MCWNFDGFIVLSVKCWVHVYCYLEIMTQFYRINKYLIDEGNNWLKHTSLTNWDQHWCPKLMKMEIGRNPSVNSGINNNESLTWTIASSAVNHTGCCSFGFGLRVRTQGSHCTGIVCGRHMCTYVMHVHWLMTQADNAAILNIRRKLSYLNMFI